MSNGDCSLTGAIVTIFAAGVAVFVSEVVKMDWGKLFPRPPTPTLHHVTFRTPETVSLRVVGPVVFIGNTSAASPSQIELLNMLAKLLVKAEEQRLAAAEAEAERAAAEAEHGCAAAAAGAGEGSSQ